MLWVGVAGDRAGLVIVAASAAKAARVAGIDVEDRPYRPHLTIARGRPGADLRPAVEALRDYRGPAWSSDELTLIESRLGAGPGGSARHDVVETFRLRLSLAPRGRAAGHGRTLRAWTHGPDG